MIQNRCLRCSLVCQATVWVSESLKWGAKGIQDSYYTVTRVRLRANGKTGDARGTLTH
ncbi:hypothetical protein RSAG8_00549, partial [Rhizoctonia solani AG-8 WAC10335]